MVILRRNCCRVVLSANNKILHRQVVHKSTNNTSKYAAPMVEANFSTVAATKSDTPSTNLLRSNVPDFEIPRVTLDQLIWHNMDRWVEKPAIMCGLTGRSYTYCKLRALSKKFGVALRNHGFKSKDVLAIMLPNMPEYAIVLMGSMEAGIIATGINPIYTPTEISHQIWDSQAAGIITLPTLVSKVEEAKKIVENKIGRSFPFKIFTIDDKSGVTTNSIDFFEMIVAAEDVLSLSDTNPEDVAVLPYSSGTTGLSKGVQLTHRNLVSNTLHLSKGDLDYLLFAEGSDQECVSAVLPFFHIYGMSIIMFLTLYKGGKIVCLPKFDPESYIQTLRQKKHTILYVAPPMVLFLAHHPMIKPNEFSSVKLILSAGGGAPISDVEKLIKKFNNQLGFKQGYGLTETSPAITGPPEICDITSVGLPVPNSTVKIISEDGTVRGPNQQGELCIKGPQVMKGYHNNPKATGEVIDDENYFHTGDIAYYNEDGFVFIVDRKKELIKVKGFQVAPMELEIILKSHPSVLDVGVVGVPDDKCGEKPVAFVVPKCDARINENQLQEFVSDKVAPYKQLKEVIFVKSIPKNLTGKILRRVLKENYVNPSKH